MDSEGSGEPLEVSEGWEGDVGVEKGVCHFLEKKKKKGVEPNEGGGGSEEKEDQSQLDRGV